MRPWCRHTAARAPSSARPRCLNFARLSTFVTTASTCGFGVFVGGGRRRSLEPPAASLGRSVAVRRRRRRESPLRGEVGARSPRRDRVPIPRFHAALFRGGRPCQRPFRRSRCRRPRRRPPQRAARVPPPPRSPEKHSRADTSSHRGSSSSSEHTAVAATIGPYDVACDVPKRPAKPRSRGA